MPSRRSLKKLVDEKRQQYRIKILEPNEAGELLNHYRAFSKTYKSFHNIYAFRLFILRNLLDQGQLWYHISRVIKPDDLSRNTSLTKELSNIYFQAIRHNPALKELITEERIDNNLERRLAQFPSAEEQPQEKEKKAESSSHTNLKSVEKYLESRIIGQPQALTSVMNILYQIETGLFMNPLPTILMQGPSGVGKTSLVKHLNEAMFEKKQPLLQVNGPDYAQDHEVSKLLGSPPGYVGSEEQGKFARFLKNYPRSIILFDEVERADHKVHEYLMMIMGDGYTFDNRNEKVDFSKAMLFMTSNLGTEEEKIGFSEKSTAVYDEALTKCFEAPFIGRLSARLVFNQLGIADAEKILDLRMREFCQRNSKDWPNLDLSPALRQRVLDQGFSKEYGARNIANALNQLVLVPLAKIVSQDKAAYQGRPLYLDYHRGKLEVVEQKSL